MRYLLLSVLVVCVIGIMIPNAFGLFHSLLGESIIEEKECDVIGKEIDPNIECRLVLKNWNEISEMPYSYDSDNDLMWFYGKGKVERTSDWDIHYVAVEMDNFTIVDEVKCNGVTTGTYTKTTTYPCELQDYDQKGLADELVEDWGDVTWLTQSQTTTPYQYRLDGSWSEKWHDFRYIKLEVFSGEKIISVCDERVGSKTTWFDCIIEDDKEIPVQPIHTYNTDIRFGQGGEGTPYPEVYLNEDRNELYYFVCEHRSMDYAPCVIYLINGMGELKSAAASEPTQSSGGCGEGTELVNGVCQLTKTSGTSQEDSFDVNNLVPIIIPIIAIVSIIALVKSRKKKSSITQPTPEKTKPEPKQKPVESRPTSSSCSNCGNPLNPKAKFCGKCGTPVS